MKFELNFIVSIVGTVVLFLFGGWTLLLNVLLFAMLFDYGTGVLAAIKGKSGKTKGGHLSSKAGFWG